MTIRRTVGYLVAAAIWSFMAWINVANAETASPALSFSDFKTSGNGCPSGSASFLATPTAFTVLFDSYVVTAGQDSTPHDLVRSCFVNMKVNVPAGWQLAIDSVDYRGFVSVNKGASAVMDSWYLLSGKGTADFGTGRLSTYKGDAEVDFLRRDQHIGPDVTRWTKCGGGKYDMTLFSYIAVAAIRKSSAYMAVDSADGAGSLKTAVQWRRCK